MPCPRCDEPWLHSQTQLVEKLARSFFYMICNLILYDKNPWLWNKMGKICKFCILGTAYQIYVQILEFLDAWNDNISWHGLPLHLKHHGFSVTKPPEKLKFSLCFYTQCSCYEFQKWGPRTHLCNIEKKTKKISLSSENFHVYMHDFCVNANPDTWGENFWKNEYALNKHCNMYCL